MFFDLYRHITTDDDFRQRAFAIIDKIDMLERTGRFDLEARDALILQLLKICHYNPGLLVPYYYPTSPITDDLTGAVQPWNLMRRPFGFALMALPFYGSVTVEGGRQIAKCVLAGSDCTVTAANGRPLSPDELAEGTEVLSCTDDFSTVTERVRSVFPAGTKPILSVKLRTGEVLSVGDEHPFRVLRGYAKARDLRAGDMVGVLRRGGIFTGKARVPRARILFTAYMLGDGCCGRSKQLSFTGLPGPAMDEFLRVAEEVSGAPARHLKPRGRTLNVRMPSVARGTTPRTWLEEDGLWNKPSHDKHIPAWVFDLDRESTGAFLGRLWATDGTVKLRAHVPDISFTSTSLRMARGVVALLAKFGWASSMRQKQGAYRRRDGSLALCRDYWHVRLETREAVAGFLGEIQVPGKPGFPVPVWESNNNRDVLPFEAVAVMRRLAERARKAGFKGFKSFKGPRVRSRYLPGRTKLRSMLDALRPHAGNDPDFAMLDRAVDGDIRWIRVDAVTPSGEGPCWDMEVTGAQHNYFLNGALVHNSTTLALLQRILTATLPGFSTLHITPHTQYRDTYATRMKAMDTYFAFRRAVGGKHLRDNLKLKEIRNGSKLELVKCDQDSAEARSKSSDLNIYDEYQLMDPDLESDIDYCMHASKIKSTIYAGTATTVDSPLACRLEDSSMGVWHVRRFNGRWINFREFEQVEACFRPEGLRDPDDRTRAIDVTNGYFVHASAARLDTGRVRIGLHVPQILDPTVSQDRLEWSTFYHDYKTRPRVKFIQEAMGIPTEEGNREITRKDLQAICTLGRSKDKLRTKAQKRQYRFIVTGVDWGGSDYQREHRTKVSYTQMCVLGINNDKTFDTLHFEHFAGQDYRDIMDRIYDAHADHRSQFIGTDFGAGSTYHMLMKEGGRIPPDSHFIFGYTAPTSRVIAEPATAQYGDLENHFSVNKTDSITQLFMAIKDKRIRCYDWEFSRFYLEQFLNVHRVLSERDYGSKQWKFLNNPTKPTDALHAMNFAYILGRLLLGEDMIEDQLTAERISALFGRSFARQAGASWTDPRKFVVRG